MVRKRDGLLPILEVFSDLDGPVKPRLGRRGFTQADQVQQNPLEK